MNSPRREHLVVKARAARRGMPLIARNHLLVVDEAERYGGHDLGPNPVEHLLAGIATSSLVVLRMLGEADLTLDVELTASTTLNVERVIGTDRGPVFEVVRLEWSVASEEQAQRLRALLPEI